MHSCPTRRHRRGTPSAEFSRALTRLFTLQLAENPIIGTPKINVGESSNRHGCVKSISRRHCVSAVPAAHPGLCIVRACDARGRRSADGDRQRRSLVARRVIHGCVRHADFLHRTSRSPPFPERLDRAHHSVGDSRCPATTSSADSSSPVTTRRRRRPRSTSTSRTS